MKDLTVLLTSAGSPAFAGALRALRMNGERNIRIVATDCDPDVYGQFMSDKFYEIHSANHPEYLDKIYDDFKKEFSGLHEKIDGIITSEKVCKAKVDIKLEWHQKAIFAGGSVLLCIVGYLIALGIEVAKVKALTP